MEYGGNPGKGYQDAEISDTNTFAKRSLHRTTIALWFMAVAIEQGGTFFCCIYDPVYADIFSGCRLFSLLVFKTRNLP